MPAKIRQTMIISFKSAPPLAFSSLWAGLSSGSGSGSSCGRKVSSFGCCGTVYNLADDEKFNHRCRVEGGVLSDECIRPVKEFFQKLRMLKNSERNLINS